MFLCVCVAMQKKIYIYFFFLRSLTFSLFYILTRLLLKLLIIEIYVKGKLASCAFASSSLSQAQGLKWGVVVRFHSFVAFAYAAVCVFQHTCIHTYMHVHENEYSYMHSYTHTYIYVCPYVLFHNAHSNWQNFLMCVSLSLSLSLTLIFFPFSIIRQLFLFDWECT